MAAEKAAQFPCTGVESNSVYKAHPLNVSDSTNIRLLSFIPTSSLDDPTTIRLNIGVFPFDESPPYTALSYVCGQNPPSKDILLDKHLVKVRSNLWDFLNRARHDDAITYLWIDALCIDQSSIAERNHQVAIMGPIYERAETTAAWLGAGPPNLVKAVRSLTQGSLARDTLLYRITSTRDELLSDLSTLSQAEYWSRMWTIQEFALAKQPSLWCGHHEKIKGSVVDIYECIGWDNHSRIPDDGVEKMRKYSRLRNRCQKQGPGLQNDLHNLLADSFQHLGQCSDPRDRIYSILFLASDELSSYPIEVDYGQTTFDLYFSLVNRRFKQLDEEDMERWFRLCELYFFAHRLVRYLEIESDQKVALTVSEIYRLGTAPGYSTDSVSRWRQVRRLISNRGGARETFL